MKLSFFSPPCLLLTLACSSEPGLLDVGIEGTWEIACTETGEDLCEGLCQSLTDGHYCGSSAAMNGYAGSPNDLITCVNQVVTEQVPCPLDCLDMGQEISDACHTLERCGDGFLDPGERCDTGACCAQDCLFSPPQESCKALGQAQYGCPWGTGLGQDLGLRRRERLCSGLSASCEGELGPWGAWALHQTCGLEEACLEGSSSCQCQNESAWTPDLVAETDPEGSTPAPLDAGIRLELSPSQVLGHLQVRACKLDEESPNFENEVHVQLTDAFGSILFDGPLPGTGELCSVWGELLGEELYTAGAELQVRWQLVSPSSVGTAWQAGCEPVVPSVSPGTCWGGTSLGPLTRSCAGL